MGAMIKALLAASVSIIVARPAMALAADAPPPAPLVKDGAWAGLLRAGHPRLLGPRDYLSERKAVFPQHYEMMKSNESIIAAGIIKALEGADRAKVDAFLSTARTHVAKGATNAHQDTWIAMTDVAQAYDFFYDSVSPEERTAWVNWLNAHLETYTEDEICFHNSTLSKILCYLRVAYATWGENPRAKDFRDYAIVKLYEGKVLSVLNEFGAGGGFTECGWYSRHSLWHLVEGLEIARRFEGYDGFAKSPTFYYERLAYELLQPYPGLWTYGSERYACEGDGSLVYGGANEYPRLMRTLLAQYFRGSELARYTAAKARPASNSMSRIADFQYLEKLDEPLDIRTFPAAHVATGIGKVYARTDWTDDASWLRFECGDYYVGHQHYEVGNFEIFRYEPLATESGEYTDYVSSHSVNWLMRTIAHNCILIYEPGETWSQMRDGGRHAYANDGGQTKKWEWTVGSLSEWMEKRETFERGNIIAYDNKPEYMFVAGDCAAAYSPAKLESWVRQIVFLRPHTFVVFDRVVSVKPDYEKTWLLHCRLQPEVRGGSFTVKDGKGRLDALVLIPQNPVVNAIEGCTYGGQTFEEVESPQKAASARWRVEVKPSKPAKEDIFLTVLSTDGPVKADCTATEGKVRVNAGGATITFDGKAGGTLTIRGKEVRLEPALNLGSFQK